MTVRVLLADDQPLIRAGLRMVVDGAPGVAVVGEAGTGAQAVRLTRELGPDVVVMDIRIPEWTASRPRGSSPGSRRTRG